MFNLYTPQVEAREAFFRKYAGHKTAETFIASEKHESELYYKYKDYYEHVFLLVRKSASSKKKIASKMGQSFFNPDFF